MAVQSGTVPSASATATLVGNAFVSQYYNVLQFSPHNVHRFYTDQSKLCRAEVGIDTDIVETLDKIQEKIMSMDLDGVHAKIKTVDSLASLNGSVLVMVTGVLPRQSGIHRSFVQTFFLAPQEKGYFVLSDICRFLDGESEDMSNNALEEIAADQNNEVFPPSDQDVSEHPPSHVVESDSIDLDSGVEEEEEDITAGDTSMKDDTDSVVNAPSHQEPVPEEVEEQTPVVKVESTEGAAKMSYASILREASGTSFSNRQSVSRAPPSRALPASSTGSSQSLPRDNMASGFAGVSAAVQDGATDGGDGHSVYVKKLPLNILQGDLEKEFERFGTIVPGGVTLRNQKQGVCFAFIQFEDASSVRNAVEASPISIGGRQVFIEEKKLTSVVPAAGRGRGLQGRGYQTGGMNGRGNFGGRGFGRGGYNSERDFSGRGRGGRGSYAANSNGSDGNYLIGYRKGDNQVGNGLRPARRGTSD